jgi:hypothetical protein
MTTAEGMIRAYFRQTRCYYSESKEVFVPIADMHPRHAANAAKRLTMDADVWIKEAGVTQTHPDPDVWMWGQPLFQALASRANR